MANLYGTQLGDVADAARIVEAPAQGGGEALGALAKGLNVLSNVWDDHVQQKRQAAADARAAQDQEWQAQDRARADSERAAANDFAINEAQTNFSLRNPPVLSSLGNQQTQAVTSPYNPMGILPSSPLVDSDTQKSINSVLSTQAAIDQGKMPAISAQGKTEELWNTLIGRHPGNEAFIAKQFREAGIGNALTDEITDAFDAQAAARKSGREEATKMSTIAQENLPPDVYGGMSDAERVNYGLQYTRNQNTLDASVKQATLQGQLQTQTQSGITFNQTQSSQQYFQTTTAMLGEALAPIAKSMQQLVLSAGEPGADPSHDIRLGQLIGQAKTAANVMKQRIIAQGGFTKPEDIDQVNSFVDKYVNDNFVQPYEDRNKGFAQASQAFQTHFGLSAAVSAPVIYDLQHRFGIRASDLPGVLQAVQGNQQLTQALSKEFQGAGQPGINQNVATLHLTNALAILRGDKTLTDLGTPQDRQQAVATNYNYVIQNRHNVSAGNGNGNYWLNSTRAVLMATGGFNPNTDVSTLQSASAALFDGATINAVNKLSGDSSTAAQAKDIQTGLRASAAITLQSAQSKIKNLHFDNTSPYRVVVTNDGHYAAVQNPQWKGSYSSLVKSGYQTQGLQRGGVPAEVSRLVDTANRSVMFLAATGQWDADAPKGTPKEVRRLWALGEPTPAMQAQKKSGKTPATFDQMANAVERDLAKTPDLIPTQYANADIEGPEGTGQNPRSSAFGVGQFTKSTWKDVLQKHAPELIQGKTDDDIYAMRENKELARKAIGWYRGDNAVKLSSAGVAPTHQATALAHFAGPGGAIALYKADPSASVESVLGADAVNANPQLKGKTVAETIQWANNFYHA